MGVLKYKGPKFLGFLSKDEIKQLVRREMNLSWSSIQPSSPVVLMPPQEIELGAVGGSSSTTSVSTHPNPLFDGMELESDSSTQTLIKRKPNQEELDLGYAGDWVIEGDPKFQKWLRRARAEREKQDDNSIMNLSALWNSFWN